MIRSHNTSVDNINLNMIYTDRVNTHKPNGLWYSIDNEWHDFVSCIDDEYLHVKEFDYILELDFKKILVINNLNDIKKLPIKTINDSHGYVDFYSIKNQYSGFELRNFHAIKNICFFEYLCTPILLFFYGLDCSGGCIWDLSSIKSIKKTKCELFKNLRS